MAVNDFGHASSSQCDAPEEQRSRIQDNAAPQQDAVTSAPMSAPTYTPIASAMDMIPHNAALYSYHLQLVQLAEQNKRRVAAAMDEIANARRMAGSDSLVWPSQQQQQRGEMVYTVRGTGYQADFIGAGWAPFEINGEQSRAYESGEEESEDDGSEEAQDADDGVERALLLAEGQRREGNAIDSKVRLELLRAVEERDGDEDEMDGLTARLYAVLGWTS